MNIESVINTELIHLSLVSESKIDALNQLIDLLYKTDRISDKDSFLQEVLDREQTETTGGFLTNLYEDHQEDLELESPGVFKIPKLKTNSILTLIFPHRK